MDLGEQVSGLSNQSPYFPTNPSTVCDKELLNLLSQTYMISSLSP